MHKKNSNPYQFDFSNWLKANQRLVDLYQHYLDQALDTRNLHARNIKQYTSTRLTIMQAKLKLLKELEKTTLWLSYQTFDKAYNKKLVFAYLYSQGFVKELYDAVAGSFTLEHLEFEESGEKSLLVIFNEQSSSFQDLIESAENHYIHFHESLADIAKANVSIPYLSLVDGQFDEETTSISNTATPIANADFANVNCKFFEYCASLQEQAAKVSETAIAPLRKLDKLRTKQAQIKTYKQQLTAENLQIGERYAANLSEMRMLEHRLNHSLNLLRKWETAKAGKIDMGYKTCLWLKNNANPLSQSVYQLFSTKLNHHVNKIEVQLTELATSIQLTQANLQQLELQVNQLAKANQEATKAFRQNQEHIQYLDAKLTKIARIEKNLFQVASTRYDAEQQKTAQLDSACACSEPSMRF